MDFFGFCLRGPIPGGRIQLSARFLGLAKSNQRTGQVNPVSGCVGILADHTLQDLHCVIRLSCLKINHTQGIAECGIGWFDLHGVLRQC